MFDFKLALKDAELKYDWRSSMNCELCQGVVKLSEGAWNIQTQSQKCIAKCPCHEVEIEVTDFDARQRGHMLGQAWDESIQKVKDESARKYREWQAEAERIQKLKDQFKNKHKHRAKLSKKMALYGSGRYR
jgi:hypothetical protein